MTIAAGSEALASDMLKALKSDGNWEFAPAAELTISSGVIVITQNYHRVDTEGNAASDDLDTINGGTEGFLLVLRAEDAARTIVVKDGTGNILLPGGDYELDDGEKMITLICDGSNWRPLFAPPSHGVDSGMIAIFVAACPTGWTRVSAWDGKYLRGAASYGGAGGAATHDHTVSDHIHSFAHTHNQKIGVWAPKIYADGDWENKMGYSSGGASGADIYGQVANDSNSYNRVASGFASGGGDSGLGGAGNTGAVNHEPPYIEVIFCKKD